MADLLFLLRNTPMIPNFSIDTDQRYLEAIEERYKTKDAIKTNYARFLIICKQPW